MLTRNEHFKKQYDEGRKYETESQKRVLAYFNKMEDGHTIGIEQDNTNHWRVHYDFELLTPCKTQSIFFEVKNDKRSKFTEIFFI